MMYRLVVAGLALDSLSQPAYGSEWVNPPRPLEWDDLDEAVSYAVSESNCRGGQAVDVIDWGTGTAEVRVSTPGERFLEFSTPGEGSLECPPDALGATLELAEGIQAP